MKPSYSEEINRERPYDLSVNQSVVVNNTAGSIVGYKYFNLDSLDRSRQLDLVLRLKPLGVEGTVTVMMDSPWEVNGGVKLGTFNWKPTLRRLPPTCARTYRLSAAMAISMPFTWSSPRQRKTARCAT